MLKSDNFNDEARRENPKFSPRNANKKGQDFINELLK